MISTGQHGLIDTTDIGSDTHIIQLVKKILEKLHTFS